MLLGSGNVKPRIPKFFGNIDKSQKGVTTDDCTLSVSSKSLEDGGNLDTIDKQYFAPRTEFPTTTTGVSTDELNLKESDNYVDTVYFGKENSHSPKPATSFRRKTTGSKTKSQCKPDEKQEDVFRISDVLKDVRSKTRANLWTGSTLDLPKSSVRDSLESERLDSHGYRIPDDDQIKFDFLTEDEASRVLFKAVLDIRDDVIVLNKPYGLSSQPGPSHKHSVSALLPRLEFLIRKSTNGSNSDGTTGRLFLTHRLDRECTGLMLIARNQESAYKIQEAFAKRLIVKEYLCITSGIPKSPKGSIQLPLAERNFNGKYKICIAPLMRSVQRNVANSDSVRDLEDVRQSRVPTTNYELLDAKNFAALLLCSSLSGSKHQIRVHLAMGLGTPILGDHKYSHASHLSPQRLNSRLLEHLHIRQSKVRHLVLHLHAARMRFTTSDELGFNPFSSSDSSPEPNKMPIIVAPPPDYFLRNAQRIGLKLPAYLSRLFLK